MKKLYLYFIQYRNLAPLYYSDAQVAILVFDITIEKSLEDCKFWLKELREKGPKGLSFVLLGNKEDYTCEFSEEIKDEFIKSPRKYTIYNVITLF